MAARQGVPVIGSQCASGEGAEGSSHSNSFSPDEPYFSLKRWQVSLGYRYQRSHRHFVGTVEQKQREEQGTEVINNIHLLDFSATYDLNSRLSFTIGVPLLIAKRINQGTLQRLTNPSAPDQISNSLGIGDIMITGRVAALKTARSNVALSLGLKLPTGNPGVRDTVNTVNGRVERVNDQSIQPGDGGYGVSVGLQLYRVIRRNTLFLSGVYLINPRNTNGVLTGRSRRSEAVMSVADQYLASGGFARPFPKIRGLAYSLSGRMEGVPVRDIIGKSEGFRRPGYAISIEPGLIYKREKETWSISVPVPLERNRRRSVSDIMDNRHGDAAFADYVILLGYSRRF